MYATGQDPETGRPVFVEKNPQRKAAQKAVLAPPASRRAPRGRS
jgi:hypothetical protein